GSAMSSPFGWWEGAGPTSYPDTNPSSPLWNHDNSSTGGGSCQHMWGQATASKVLYDSLIAERIYDDNKNVDIIIGRGIPKEWLTNSTKDNNVIADVKNYPVLQGGRAGYTIERSGNSLKVTMDCDRANSKVASGTTEQWNIQLPSMVNNISSVSTGTIDNANGTVTVPIDTQSVTITLKDLKSDFFTIDTAALKDGKVGDAYQAELTAIGGTAPYTWSAEGLPAGLSMTAQGKIEGTPTVSGTFSVTVKAADSSNPVVNESKTLSITIAPSGQTGGSTGSNSGSSGTSSSSNTRIQIGTTKIDSRTTMHSVEIKAQSGAEAGTAVANLGQDTINSLVAKAKETNNQGQKAIIDIKLASAQDTKAIKVGVPADALKNIAVTGSDVRVETGIGSVTFDEKSIETISKSATAGDVTISINKADVSALPEEVKAKIGSRPVYNFTVQAGDKKVSDFGGGNVKAGIPYTPKSGEKYNSIIIYYIDDSGNLKTVRSVYNPATGNVEFSTKHFSQYAVGYNEVNFGDVSSKNWFDKAVGFMSARSIIKGVGKDNFAPENKVTRADFLIMLMNSYGIEVDKTAADNFSDAGSKYYTRYLATAKRLGLVSGVGDNKFSPEATISRQDMLVMLYSALDTLGELPAAKTDSFGSYSDAGEISGYAKDALKLFVDAGVVSGDNGKLSPKDTTSRAEAAQVLYNLLSK
ncbi:MAG TPA: S-layer homology domain-containing protein, partial [Ruminiclostridium sp.]|nr:S-layer homology domain-containing protein [Ruminiclostridium sp.]